jgi:hypothetical protein
VFGGIAMECSWLDWDWVDSDRVGGKRVEVRWDGYFSNGDGYLRGQVRFEDGRVFDIVSRHEEGWVRLSNGDSIGCGEYWVESDGNRYNNLFDLIMNLVTITDKKLPRSNVVRKKVR